MKYLTVLLVLVQLVLVIGCDGTVSQTISPAVMNETTAIPITTELQPAPSGTESKPVPAVNVVKPPVTGLKPDALNTGAKPAQRVTIPPTPAPSPTPTPVSSTLAPAEIQKVLNLGIMVHLEGWDDAREETKFRNHAELLRGYADLFEKYGAKLTLESKEMTDGAMRWDDNILLEMQERGHAVGVHADVGGSASETARQMELKLTEMKSRLESLDVTVQHVSGICSRSDWVTAAAKSGYKFVTGTVAFALASLSPGNQVMDIPTTAQPAQFHESYPFTLEGRLHSWRAENGYNWIVDTPTGDVVIIPSGGGIAYTYEESQGQTGLAGDQQFTIEDITAFEKQLKEILAYIKSDQSTQPYSYYLSWSFGKALDQSLMEQWLKMVDKYVDSGLVQWQTIPEMYDDYIQWEIDTGRK
jgi:hypothetical protein